jgi:hypothetical protein
LWSSGICALRWEQGERRANGLRHPPERPKGATPTLTPDEELLAHTPLDEWRERLHTAPDINGGVGVYCDDGRTRYTQRSPGR